MAAELRCGAAKKGSLRLTSQLEAVLRALEVLSLESPTDAVYGKLRARLERAGQLMVEMTGYCRTCAGNGSRDRN